MYFIAERTHVLIINAKSILKLKPLIAVANAVPEAGGCSVPVITIRSIDSPTAKEYIADVITGSVRGKNSPTYQHREPLINPIMCPPITFLGLAVTLPGIVKTMNAEAPIEATITMCCKLSVTRTTKIATIARKLCRK